jgi:predicted nucleotidyltransferase
MEVITSYKYKLFSTPILRVLDFLLQNSDAEFSDSDIGFAALGVKKSSINSALRLLSAIGWVERKKVGKTATNRLCQREAIISYLKIASNLLTISRFVEESKKYSYKMILFGSRADGSNVSDSDFDILTVTHNADMVRKIWSSADFLLQLVVKIPEEMIGLYEKEPTLSKSIAKGIVLWEKI